MSDASEIKHDECPSYEYELGRFPERLRKAIGARSVRSFASECGMSDTVLRQYLSGKSEPSRIALIAIAREASVRIEWLVSGSGREELSPTPAHLTAAHNELRDKLRLGQLPPAQIIQENPVELSLDQLSKYLNGKGILSEDQLRWLSKRVHFSHVDDLFMESKGEPAGNIESQLPFKDVGISENHRRSVGYVRIPRYDAAASAGAGTINVSEQVVDYIQFKQDWIKNVLGISAQYLSLISVKGDSMEPTLSDGDTILVDTTDRQFETNAIYVLQLEGSLLVKRIQRKVDGTIIIKSDNRAYEPETVRGDIVEQLKVVGRVVWYGRRG
jgi:transcriptional regulator with XRE-family HTH domain